MAILMILPAALAQGEEKKPPQIPADKDPITTESGLIISVLREGTGKVHPKMWDEVTCHYTGWLKATGKVFDSSVQRGQPLNFRLGQVIEGWNEGLKRMVVGSKVKLTIPPAIGYGARGSPPAIPPGSTLIFEVELLKVEPGGVPVWSNADEKTQKKTESGIVYEVIKTGEGDAPKTTDNVVIKYTCWGLDKKMVDCSALRGEETKFKIDSVRLAFLKEVLPMMAPGGVWRCEVPSKLAFGARKVRTLEGGSDSVWQVELIRIVRPMTIPKFVVPTAEQLTTKESGLQIQVLTPGTGKSPKMGQKVVCHYAGWLKKDGKLFDSSYGRGDPATFGVGRLIEGWNEALLGMKEGEEVILVIPAKLGYGSRGSPPVIGPDADLVFRMHLIEVK
ncbi:MAG: hypothetical protein CMJ83_14475 [Planctomycetes bacterium]|nr:hypothetical protein [Planctomycetota bacterium]